jgi:hypothetical protein
MHLVFVHGINNQDRSERQIIDEWLGALGRVLSSSDMATIRAAEIVAPYYGDVLYAATMRQSKAGIEPVAQSVADAPGDEAEFYRQALEDMAPAAGVTESDVAAEVAAKEAVEQGFPHDRRLLGLLRALEFVSPFRGSLVLRFLPQAFVYLHRDAVANEIDAIVRPVIKNQPSVIVGHSLGSVVTFKLIRAEEAIRVPFYLTLGSPLALAAVQNAIGPAFGRPDYVRSWLNGLDRDDAVTIGRSLTDTAFGPGIVNIDDIDNGDENPHDICMYLRDHRIAEALVRAVSGGNGIR